MGLMSVLFFPFKSLVKAASHCSVWSVHPCSLYNIASPSQNCGNKTKMQAATNNLCLLDFAFNSAIAESWNPEVTEQCFSVLKPNQTWVCLKGPCEASVSLIALKLSIMINLIIAFELLFLRKSTEHYNETPLMCLSCLDAHLCS